VLKHLPDEQDQYRLPRTWIINLMYSVEGQSFKTWIDGLVKQRNLSRHSKLDSDLLIDEELYAIYQNSKHVSGKF
jgi:hypothetical protein